MVYIDTNTWLFQFGMALYFVSYLSDNILFLRFVLAAASVLLFAMTMNLPEFTFIDVFWNVVFFFINFFHGCYLLWQMRPVEFEDEDFKNFYEKVFAAPQSAMSKLEFVSKIAKMGSVHQIKKGDLYAEYGSKLQYLSILIHGSLDVYDVLPSGVESHVNEVLPFEFIDSPQWLIRHKVPNQTFVVILRAKEDCRYIALPIDKLERVLKNHPEYKTYFDGVIGCDVAEKLLHVEPGLNEEHPIITQSKMKQSKSRKLASDSHDLSESQSQDANDKQDKYISVSVDDVDVTPTSATTDMV